MATAAPQRMTLPEFLSWDDGTDTRYELVRGDIVAMAPPSARHGRIVGNVARHIGNHLKPACGVHPEAGVVLPDGADTYYQGDLAVNCAMLEEDSPWAPDPILQD